MESNAPYFQKKNRVLDSLQRFGLWLFVFLLPWQTHYVLSDGVLAGGMSPYLTRSIYLFDVLVLGLVLLAVVGGRAFEKNVSRVSLFLVAFLLVAFLSLAFASDRAQALYMWIRLLEGIVVFVLVLRLACPRTWMISAFVAAGVVQSGLALWQFADQRVVASTWLGMAAQHPLTLGTPVVQAGAERVMRAFGSFSHPNILGGFLAIALCTAFGLLVLARNSRQRVGLLISISFVTAGLFVSFSRSAWLAAVAAALTMLVLAWRGRERMTVDLTLGRRSRTLSVFSVLLIGIALSGVTFGAMASSYAPLFFARVQAEGRVEQRSLTERQEYTRDAFTLFSTHWAEGVGLGNITQAVYHEIDSGRAVYDYQPPPNVFLLVFTELGVFGGGLFVLLIADIFFARCVQKQRLPRIRPDAVSSLDPAIAGISVALIVLMLFDHYLRTIPHGILLFWLIIAMQLRTLTNND